MVVAWLVLAAPWSGPGPQAAAPIPSSNLEISVGQAPPATEQPPVVYLTFDDGPHPVYTPMVLDVLARYDAKATFYVVGEMVSRYPEVTRRIASEGHSIQAHTWRHDDLTKLTREEFMADSRKVQAVLAETVRRRATCLRPPYGSINEQVRGWASEIYLDISMWDVSGLDWTDISAERIAGRVTGGSRADSVVLLHDGGGPRRRTVEALATILDDLGGKGFEFGSQCLSRSLPSPDPRCWVYYGWPQPRDCDEDGQPVER